MKVNFLDWVTDCNNPFLLLTFHNDGYIGSTTTREKENQCDKSSTSSESTRTNETTNKQLNKDDIKEYEGPIDANNDIKETSSKKKKESNDSSPEVSRL